MLNVYTLLILRISLVFISVVSISHKKRGLQGWNGIGDGREVQERTDICIPMADSYY